ncbi:MAG TPA: NAD(P)H-dependent oxidoreductase [Opitutaceae bacterium]|nr:NAD(P)H-dependent oxidoreductase [Opitutaceae bacterium]
MAAPRILAFSGSSRRESLNRKFLDAAVEEARAAGGEVTLLNLADYPLPLFNGDLEDAEGMPAPAKSLVELIAGHAALLVASPEYNSLITPLLKNTIDWCTRGDANPFVGRAAAVITASPGQFGGSKSGLAARQLLSRVGCVLVPRECALPHAHEAFDERGRLKSAHAQQSLRELAAELVRLAGRLTS